MNRKVLLIFFSILLAGCQSSDQVCFESICIDVEIADTSEERAKGLMHRESMPEDQGMLFIFDTQKIYPFWMKNTLIPLDMIWVDMEQTIVHIESAIPCVDTCPSYTPSAKALYVVETVQGFTAKHEIKVGDKVEIRKNY